MKVLLGRLFLFCCVVVVSVSAVPSNSFAKQFYALQCSSLDDCLLPQNSSTSSTGNLVCFYGYCQCPLSSPYAPAWGNRCVRRRPSDCVGCAEYQAPCDDDLQCRTDLVCDKELQTCQCPVTGPFFYAGNGECTYSSITHCPNSRRRCLNEGLGGAQCPQGGICYQGCCTYADGVRTEPFIFNEYCAASPDTGCLGALNCSAQGYCQCPDNAPYYQYNNDNCISDRPDNCIGCAEFNAACEVTDECRGRLQCANKVCQCPVDTKGSTAVTYIGKGTCSNMLQEPPAKYYHQQCGNITSPNIFPCLDQLVCIDGRCQCPTDKPDRLPGTAGGCYLAPKTMLASAGVNVELTYVEVAVLTILAAGFFTM